eukprot:TRINITY_DN1053_c0_g2_i1.p1 TRINITY_DN1053_c0_g2~~TRINITY_DN1053_c0_g2_i1.p1  ORF type:complete len:581 (+),score=85.60 TRINITY_DN1053_c0_g2_i1:63-1805(+)
MDQPAPSHSPITPSTLPTEWDGLSALDPKPEIGPSVIVPFFRQHAVLLTGVTGYVGKVLLWKLLKTCGPRVVYVIIREKRNQSPQERFDKEVLKSPIFKEFPDYVWRERVRVVHGDVIEKDLGLSAENKLAVTNEVGIILHGAATTKFNEHIKIALKINTVGVRNVLRLARECKQLVSLVHVSTAYVNYPAKNGEVQEAIYSKSYDVGSIVKRILQMDDNEAEAKTPSLITPYPNTYSYTKHLGENVLLQERRYSCDGGVVKTLPLCVVRPTIIVPAMKEPFPGWVDTMIGPAGLSVAGALGFLRFVRADPNYIVDFIPVDYVCNAILASAWYNTLTVPSSGPTGAVPSVVPHSTRGVESAEDESETTDENTTNSAESKTLTRLQSSRLSTDDKSAHHQLMLATTDVVPIYHIATSAINPTTWRSLNKFAAAYFRLYRSKHSMGPDPWNVMTTSKPVFETAHMLLHVFPASLMDAKLILSGKKAKMVKMSQRLYGAVDQLSPFTLNYWLFVAENTAQLWDELEERDRQLFPFDVSSIKWPAYYMTYCEGLRRYLLKEEHLPLTAIKTNHAASLTNAAAAL